MPQYVPEERPEPLPPPPEPGPPRPEGPGPPPEGPEAPPRPPDIPVPGRAARAAGWIVAGPARILIIAGWVAGVALAMLYLPSLAGQKNSALGSMTPSDARAVSVEKRSFAIFGSTVMTRTVLVQHLAGGLPLSVQQAALRREQGVRNQTLRRPTALLAAVPLVNERGIVPGSRGSGDTMVTYLFFDPRWTPAQQVWGTNWFAAHYLQGGGQGYVGPSGLYPAWEEQGNIVLHRLPLVTIATVALIALLVGFMFRSVAAPLVTLVAGGIAYLVADRVIAWLAQRLDISAPLELQPLMIVLLLGIVTDYSIFFLSGHRHYLGQGLPGKLAARRSVAEYGPVVLTAGFMVAAGTMGLLVASLGYFRAFGPGLGLTVFIGLAVSVTLVPALLATFGRLVFWPGRVSRVEPFGDHSTGVASASGTSLPSRMRARLLRFTTLRPVAIMIAVLAVAVLVVASTGLRDLRLGFQIIGGLPPSSPVDRAAQAAQQGFAPGILSPTEVLIQKTGITVQTAGLARLQHLLASEPGVASVVGPAEAQGAGAAAGNLQQGSTARGALQAFSAGVLSRNGNAARYILILNVDPLSSRGIDTLSKISSDMPRFLQRTGLAGSRVGYAGDTALAKETIDRTLGDLLRISVAVLAIDLVLLIIFLRALVAPLYLLVTSALALTASLGLAAYFFQDLLGWDGLVYYVPFAAAVLLISLGSDYNVFLVGSIWEEARVRPIRAAIEVAVPRARRAISAAALTLAGSFALLAIIPVASFRELAFLLAVGVLLDSFVVRSRLVPALVAAFGNLSAWPWKLRHRRAWAAPVPEPAQPATAQAPPPQAGVMPPPANRDAA